jgi:hypothetical protein
MLTKRLMNIIPSRQDALTLLRKVGNNILLAEEDII